MTSAALSNDRIAAAAAEVADRGGLSAVSVRSVARALEVEAMSLYHLLADTDALLDTLADHLYGQVDLPALDAPWRPAMFERAESLRAVLARHPWALGLIQSRPVPGPATFRHHDTVLGNLRCNGFSLRLAAHAFSVLNSYVFGYVSTEVIPAREPGDQTVPATPSAATEESAGTGGAGEMSEGLVLAAVDYPFLMEMAGDLLSARNQRRSDEFGYGLELILDALELRLRIQQPD